MHVFLFTFFFHYRSFSPWCSVAASISRFLTAAVKFSCFSSNEIGLFFLYIYFALAPSLLSTLM